MLDRYTTPRFIRKAEAAGKAATVVLAAADGEGAVAGIFWLKPEAVGVGAGVEEAGGDDCQNARWCLVDGKTLPQAEAEACRHESMTMMCGTALAMRIRGFRFPR